MSPHERLAAAGLVLPKPPPPGGAYKPVVIAGTMLHVAAQFPIENGVMRYTGRLGDALSVEEGRLAARLAALNVLAQIETALGGFEPLVQLVHVNAWMLTAPGFDEMPRVLDGASELFNLALAERAGHTRSLLGAASLPRDLCIELVVTAEVRGGGL